MDFIKSYSSAKAAKTQATKLAAKTGFEYIVIPFEGQYGISQVFKFKPAAPVVENKKGVVYVDGKKLGNYFAFGPVDEGTRIAAVTQYTAYTGNAAMKAAIDAEKLGEVNALIEKAKTCWGAIEAVKKMAESAYAV